VSVANVASADHRIANQQPNTDEHGKPNPEQHEGIHHSATSFFRLDDDRKDERDEKDPQGRQASPPGTFLEEIADETRTEDVKTSPVGASSLQPLASSPIEYIPITEVQPGDYVLSLNEATGKLEPHRINGLLDMGVQPVFKLTTASGRTIRTTGNHPYLVMVEGGRWKIKGDG